MLQQIPSFHGELCCAFEMALLNSNRLNGKSSAVPGFCTRILSLHCLAFKDKFHELWLFTNVFARSSAFSVLLTAFILLLYRTGTSKLHFMLFIFLIIPHTSVSLPILMQYCLQYLVWLTFQVLIPAGYECQMDCTFCFQCTVISCTLSIINTH